MLKNTSFIPKKYKKMVKYQSGRRIKRKGKEMARTLLVYCPICKEKSVIQRTVRVHSELSNLYCTCKNPNCKHKFVYNLEFSHTTQTSLLTQQAFMENLINKLSDSDKNQLKRLLA